MKQITRNLITYNAEVHATPEELRERLQERLFVECGEHQRVSYGFAPVVLGEEETLLLEIPGGLALCLRHDSKGVPQAEVTKLVEEKVAAIKEHSGRTVGKKERKDLVAEAIDDLLPRAFTRSVRIHVLISNRTGNIFVNTGAQKMADVVMTELTHVLKSIKTTTVHVSEPKMGLTTRLLNWLDDKDEIEAFGDMHPQGSVVMAGGKNKWSVKADTLRNTERALREAIAQGATVDSIGFCDQNGLKFRVSAALRVKGVEHETTPAEDATEHHQWVSQLASEMVALDGIFDHLLELLKPETAQATTETPTSDGVGVQTLDDLDDLFA